MVLDPLSSIALAGNVLQFVEFAFKLVSETREIHSSATGVSSRHESWEYYSQQFTGITSSIESASSRGVDAYGPDMMELCNTCTNIAQAIQHHLGALRQKGRRTAWKNFVQAMKETGRKDQLVDLSGRLCKLQDLLNLRLVVLMTERQSSMHKKLVEIFDAEHRLGMNRDQVLQRLRDEVVDSLKSLDRRTTLQTSTVEKHLSRIRQQKPVSDSDINELSSKMSELSEKLSRFVQQGTTMASEQILLRSLQFSEMRDRQENIHKAGESTLHWIFDGPLPSSFQGKHPNLSRWLGQKNEIYWVQGKPGSGKSTLMKFLYGHKKTKEVLQRWASPKKLVTASYFFWCAGNKMQRSLKGLLQSLLYEVLRQCPDLIRHIFPDFASIHYHGNNEPWAFAELEKAFSCIREQQDISARFCFFIDGLDEYDAESNEGTHNDLVRCLKGLAQSPDIKLCLASRPWNIFRDAFGTNAAGGEAEWMLALEHLNRGDIDSFVRTSFDEDARFVELHKNDSRYGELIIEIVDKSQGVFLWVFLVVRSLKEGLDEADRILDLQNRLRLIPPTLKGFFRQILGSVHESYQKQTAELFTMMLESTLPLSLMTLSIVYEEDPDYCFKHLEPLSEQQRLVREDKMRRRINARCKGLVEVSSSKDWVPLANRESYAFSPSKVEFIHRTVRDFLENKEMEVLFEHLDRDFSPHLVLAKSFLAQIKMLPPPKHRKEYVHSVEDTFLLTMLAHSARRVEETTGGSLFDLFNEAEAALHWPEERFIGFLVQRGIYKYATEQLRVRPSLMKTKQRPLLDYALDPQSDSYSGPTISVGFVDAILKHRHNRADPNAKYLGKTVWQRFLERAYTFDAEILCSNDILFLTTKLLLERGADPEKEFVSGFVSCRKMKEDAPLIRAINSGPNLFTAEQRAELSRLTRVFKVNTWLHTVRMEMVPKLYMARDLVQGTRRRVARCARNSVFRNRYKSKVVPEEFYR